MQLTPDQSQEIERARAIQNTTRRVTVPALEAMLYTAIPILDHGFIRVIDYMGDDAAVCQAARVSYGKGTKTVSDDRALIRYLMRHRHCYHPDMQVLTAEGWKRWSECRAVEPFLVPDPVTKRLSIERLPVASFDCDEELFTYENSRMSYKVTSGHTMWFRGKYSDKFRKVKVENMPKWGWFEPLAGYTQEYYDGEPIDAATVDDQFRFLGFYLGDGSYASPNRVTFHLKKDRKKTFLIDLLERLRFDYTVQQSATYEDAILVTVVTPDVLREWIEVKLRAADKAFPMEKLADLTLGERWGLFEGLFTSDGTVPAERDYLSFSSTSEGLLALFEALAPNLGFDAHRIANNRVNAHPEGRTSLESRAQYHGREAYTGKVYCTTSSTGLLIVRGGPDKFGFVCGNSTPSEMCEIKFHVKMPIFVARQWIRHRTANINEYSARYSVLDREFYVPAPEHLAAQSDDNKQGRGQVLSGDEADHVLHLLKRDAATAYDDYLDMLNEDEDGNKIDPERQGLARELARMNLPISAYTQWYWKVDLHNLLHFLGLRADRHAQFEIRTYAETMLDITKRWVPHTAEAFEDYRLGATTLSRQGLDVVRRLLQGEQVPQATSGMSAREYRELMVLLQPT